MEPIQALVTVLLAIIGILGTMFAALIRGDVVPRSTYDKAETGRQVATTQAERNQEALAANNALLDKFITLLNANERSHSRALASLTAEVRSYRADKGTRGTHGLA